MDDSPSGRLGHRAYDSSGDESSTLPCSDGKESVGIRKTNCYSNVFTPEACPGLEVIEHLPA